MIRVKIILYILYTNNYFGKNVLLMVLLVYKKKNKKAKYAIDMKKKTKQNIILSKNTQKHAMTQTFT